MWQPLPFGRESGGRDPQTVGSTPFSRDPEPHGHLRSPARSSGSQDTGRSWAALRSAVPGRRCGPVAAPQAVDSELATGQSPRTWGLSEPQSLFWKLEGADACQPPGEGQRCGAWKSTSPRKAAVGNPGIGAGARESGEKRGLVRMLSQRRTEACPRSPSTGGRWGDGARALTLPWITDPLRRGRKPRTRPENVPLAFCPAGDETQSPIGRVPRLGPGWLTFTGGRLVSSSEALGRRSQPCPLPPPRSPALSPGASPAGDGYYLAVGGAAAQHSWSHISAALQDRRFRCQLIDSSEDLGLLSVQGPAR